LAGFDPLPVIAFKLFAVMFLVLLNGFFVAAEFAIVKVRATQLEARVRRGEPGAKRAAHVVEHLDAYLSATQLGITLASLGLGWIGEPAVASLIEPIFFLAGIGDPAIVHTVAFIIAFGFITFLHIVIGELAPKSLAIQKAEGVTLWTSAPLHVFYKIFQPAIWALNSVANALLRSAGMRPATEADLVHSEEELRMLLAESSAKRSLTKKRAEMILNVFELKKLAARNVMTPRPRMVALDVTKPFEENLAHAEESGYTRFPLVEESLDRVVGMVHYRDLVGLARSSATAPRSLSAIRRDVIFVPDSKSVEDLLSDLLGRGRHMAIVVDEFGSTAGLVTLEDIFEELFGEIRDEFDVAEAEAAYRKIDEGHYLLEGHMPLHQASALLGVQLQSTDVTTLSGYVVAELGRLPAKGERVKLGAWDGVVREADRKRVKSIEVRRAGSAAADAA